MKPRELVEFVLGLSLSLCSTALAEEASREIYETDLTVEVGVRRLFLDVEVLDASGAPIPGLTKDDFSLRLNNGPYPIHSVDDLCGCTAEGREQQPSPNFVLFFDFSQLGPQGREIALREAERWVREVKEPGDRAMAVAYATGSGLRRLCPLTDDGDGLLEAIRVATTDPELIDPFPSDYLKRLELCTSGVTACHSSGVQEYRQTSQSAKVLSHFLTRMEALPGRKALLLFYQNNAVYPARLYSGDPSGHTFYDGQPTDSVPGLDSVIGELSGTAAATGTVVHAISCGPARDWSIDFGDALARATGGRFNRDAAELSAVLEEAGRGCACMYRIGIDPKASSKSRVLRAKVAVRDGQWLTPDYRLLQLTPEDRWRRNAGAVLLDPESATDIPIAAAILPQSASSGRWSVKLQVALDPQSLGLLPSGAQLVASWEVGAILARRGGWDAVEMTGVSRVGCPKEGCAGTVVHERTVEGLEPGVYELRAFVHDRWTDAYGGAKAELELPRPGAPSMVGPVLVAASDSYVSADLPLWRKKSNAGESAGIRVRVGDRPLGAGEAPAGALSWICGAKGNQPPPVATRRLSRGSVAFTAIEPTAAERRGPCWALSDRFDASVLAPGRYAYELEWNRTVREAPFEIAGVEPRAEPVATEVARAEPEPPAPAAPIASTPPTPRAASLPPSTLRLQELLDRVAEQASAYRDTALRFSCYETIVEQQRGRQRTLEFEYIYAYDEQGRLSDLRLARRAGNKTGKGVAPPPVDLAKSDLPAYVLRAYSSIFIFEPSIQRLYEFEILGEEPALGRPAVKVRFAAIPPHVEDLNDWFGTAWIDRETYQPLRISSLKAEDHETRLMFERGIEQDSTPTRRRRHSFDEVDVEFAVEREGVRFPSRVVLLRKEFETQRDADYLRTAAHETLRIVQSYDNYRIFGVRTSTRIAE